MSETLTKGLLEQVMRTMMRPAERRMVGMTMSPRVHEAMKRELPPLDPVLPVFLQRQFGVPVIVDPRMSSCMHASAYFDAKIWRKRVKEQKRWDRRAAMEGRRIARAIAAAAMQEDRSVLPPQEG